MRLLLLIFYQSKKKRKKTSDTLAGSREFRAEKLERRWKRFRKTRRNEQEPFKNKRKKCPTIDSGPAPLTRPQPLHPFFLRVETPRNPLEVVTRHGHHLRTTERNRGWGVGDGVSKRKWDKGNRCPPNKAKWPMPLTILRPVSTVVLQSPPSHHHRRSCLRNFILLLFPFLCFPLRGAILIIKVT